MAPEPGLHTYTTQAEERGAAQALLPVAATLDYYALPPSFKDRPWFNSHHRFAPISPSAFGPRTTATSYLGLGWRMEKPGMAYAGDSRQAGSRPPEYVRDSLGRIHIWAMTSFPEIHAAWPLPFWVMVPWFICGIASFVELNFRGFLFGRLAALESHLWRSGLVQRLSPLALVTCALTFAFDPFMVNTFQHLHWIALWDGLMWGMIWLRTRNLYITIVAHAVEVIVMYSAVRTAIG